MTDVCFSEDDFTRDRYYTDARWEAVLSDGRRAIMDDGRAGLSVNSAWLRLKAYLADNPSLRINELLVRFRSHVVSPLPRDAAGYVFLKGALGSPSFTKTVDQFLIGFLDDTNQVVYVKYNLPELLEEVSGTRPVEQVGEALIRFGMSAARS